ncbi:diacylglycerol kinase family protein [Paenibacillus sp. SEL3]|uniref:Diacylglycerol kinase family protein n=1 Tax=Paenibacillus polymyxa TaxID=1406 RepID=A0A1D7ME78_PAEPO|nr:MULTISPECIES: diacylglycerol kinase family protein [Paenibacillus]AOK89075.1 diacylglycerol kinase [Paenibacillus polymyxa]KAF6572314.1 diacylglycerol kinase family protein [Paenibacillus sp. EKM206P]KAF6578206.1 diacylglycerol kinase family protein [Paenibacillus sp. EKM212P]KAF6586725.1 diacylglycerol kinase family protein [Paenibacillus sp. EKM205P]MBM0634965.1 diacylglycerol kinase family protein [Paenibacillus polymyxa]
MRRQPWRMTFRYAAEGVMYALRTQVNMRIHVAVALLVIVAGLTLHISRLDWLFVCVAIAIVIVAELFNTAVEAAVDLISPDIHPLAKAAKDTAAGAVLLAAVFAVIIGIFVFYRPMLTLISSLF